MGTRIRWGILGTGRICGTFAEALKSLPEADLVAVGSRTRDAAAAFAGRYSIPHVHESYEKLACDPDVQAIYIGTPHPFHCENTLLCLEAGKAVLVEKPFAINEAEARRMVETARRKQVFLMEAMWTHFLPSVTKFLELARNGTIGELRLFAADFGFHAAFNPKGRLFNPALGGGSLLDVGVYPVSLATRLFGEPIKIQSSASLAATGVDEQAAMLLDYPGGRQAMLCSSICAETGHAGVLSGTRGRLRLEPSFYKSQRLTHTVVGKDQSMDLPFEGNGYTHEAREVFRCLSGGLTESPAMDLEFSLQVMRTLDRIRAPWGMKYPGE